MWTSSCSVSYTHLDVYKRQPFIPYATEEIWDTYNDDDVFISTLDWPVACEDLIDEKIEKSEEIVQDLSLINI